MVITLLDDNYVFMDVIVDVILTTKSLKYVLYFQEYVRFTCTVHYNLIHAYPRRACVHTIIYLYNTPPP